MEEDRLQTNLGASTEPELVAEPPNVTKAPKRRFVGRRSAAEKTDKQDEPSNGSIEESGAIQGIQRDFNNSRS